MDSPQKDIGLIVQIDNHFQKIDVDLARLKNLAENILESFDVSKAMVSIVIADDDEISKVNEKYLKTNSATDVLSFDLSDDVGYIKLFDLLVNGQKAMREAENRGHSVEAELALYITHGLLHNLDFNDLIVPQAEKMHQTEDQILQQHGYGMVFGNQQN